MPCALADDQHLNQATLSVPASLSHAEHTTLWWEGLPVVQLLILGLLVT